MFIVVTSLMLVFWSEASTSAAPCNTRVVRCNFTLCGETKPKYSVLVDYAVIGTIILQGWGVMVYVPSGPNTGNFWFGSLSACVDAGMACPNSVQSCPTCCSTNSAVPSPSNEAQ